MRLNKTLIQYSIIALLVGLLAGTAIGYQLGQSDNRGKADALTDVQQPKSETSFYFKAAVNSALLKYYRKYGQEGFTKQTSLNVQQQLEPSLSEIILPKALAQYSRECSNMQINQFIDLLHDDLVSRFTDNDCIIEAIYTGKLQLSLVRSNANGSFYLHWIFNGTENLRYYDHEDSCKEKTQTRDLQGWSGWINVITGEWDDPPNDDNKVICTSTLDLSIIVDNPNASKEKCCPGLITPTPVQSQNTIN